MQEVTYNPGELAWTPRDNDKFRSNKPSDFKKERVFKPDNIFKTIYTDGGSRIIPTETRTRYVGAWSFYDANTGEIFGEAADDSTNNAMELTAVIKAIEYMNTIGVPQDEWVEIALDSDYVRLGVLFWVKKWEKNDWVKRDRDGNISEIKNLELWKKLNNLNKERKIYYNKVVGHSGEEGNERVDIECRRLMDEFCKEHSIVRKK